MSDVNTEVEVDLLDSTIDDLADLKEFKPWPAGSYAATFKYETKAINEKPAIIVKFVHRETVELAKETEVPPETGSVADIALITRNNDGSRNEIAEGTLKLILRSLSEAFPGSTNREILDNAQGADVLVTLKVRKSKQDPDKAYNDVVALEVA